PLRFRAGWITISALGDSSPPRLELVPIRASPMHQFRRIFAYLCACAVVAGLAGCADSGPKRYAVSGEVKWRGKPLDHGGISFLREDSSLGSSGGGVVKDGRYSIPAKGGVLAGRHKVMVASADPSEAPDPEALRGP